MYTIADADGVTEISSIFPSPTPATTSPSSILSDTGAAAVPIPDPVNFGLNQTAPDTATIAQKQAQNAPASTLENILSRPSHVEQDGPLQARPENAAVFNPPPAPPEPEEPGAVPEEPLALPPAEEAIEDGEPAIGKFTQLSLGVLLSVCRYRLRRRS